MIEPVETFEHAGVFVEIVPDNDPANDPMDNDNAGTIYSWAHDFSGDERIGEPDLQIDTEPDWNKDPKWESIDLSEWFAENYQAALTIPLYFSDEGSRGARIYVSDDPNCALCFTQKDLDTEWSGSVDDATKYATARINELDQWMRGEVYGIVIRESEDGEVMESVWGFIGDPFGESGKYLIDEAKSMAEGCAEQVAHEAAERERWACADVVTV